MVANRDQGSGLRTVGGVALGVCLAWRFLEGASRWRATQVSAAECIRLADAQAGFVIWNLGHLR